MTKTCTRCGETKQLTLEHFPFRKSKNRFDSWCRACYRQRSRTYLALHPDHRRSRDAAYRDRNREFLRAYARKYGKEYNKREAVKVNKRRHHVKLKLAAMVAYGGAFCQCCNETCSEMLCLDHIANDGKAHRKAIGGRIAGPRFYKLLEKQGYPPGLRVLCYNCNIARHWTPTKECPHELTRQKLFAVTPAYQAA